MLVVLDCAAAYGADFAPFDQDGGEVVAGFIDCWNGEGDAFFGEKFDGDPIAGVGPFGLDAAAVSCFDVLALPLFEDGIVEDVFDLRSVGCAGGIPVLRFRGRGWHWRRFVDR